MGRFPRGHPVAASVVLVAASVGVALLIASHQAGQLQETLQSAAIALVFVALIGGIVKLLLDDYQRGRERRVEQARFVTAVLSDLKSVYDRVERSRVVISAHQSAKTYGDEMRDLIDARVQLKNVARALEAGTSGISPDRERAIISAVEAMELYLAGLTNEFSSRYKGISNAQRVYEARAKRVLDTGSDPMTLPDNEPWEEIQGLKELSLFIAERGYAARFVSHLDTASRQLREELRLLLDMKASGS